MVIGKSKYQVYIRLFVLPADYGGFIVSGEVLETIISSIFNFICDS